MSDEMLSGELRTLGNKWMHRDELSMLCEMAFNKFSILYMAVYHNVKGINQVTAYNDAVEALHKLYMRFAEVSNNPDYILELEDALENHLRLQSSDANDFTRRAKYLIDIMKKMRHQLKEDGIYNPEIVMKYQSDDMQAWKGSVGGI